YFGKTNFDFVQLGYQFCISSKINYPVSCLYHKSNFFHFVFSRTSGYSHLIDRYELPGFQFIYIYKTCGLYLFSHSNRNDEGKVFIGVRLESFDIEMIVMMM